MRRCPRSASSSRRHLGAGRHPSLFWRSTLRSPPRPHDLELGKPVFRRCRDPVHAGSRSGCGPRPARDDGSGCRARVVEARAADLERLQYIARSRTSLAHSGVSTSTSRRRPPHGEAAVVLDQLAHAARPTCPGWRELLTVAREGTPINCRARARARCRLDRGELCSVATARSGRSRVDAARRRAQPQAAVGQPPRGLARGSS